MTVTKITLTLRMVNKDVINNNYAVWEFSNNGTALTQVTKNYAHSTSAYAALGRLYQREINKLGKI